MNPSSAPLVTLGPAELQRLHAVQLQMLLEFDRVCRVLGLRYQLAAGTLLGAVRHRGFIPWDDDADVSMPRSDYRRFLAEAPALLGADYFLQHWRSDPAFKAHFAKLRRNDSEFRNLNRAHAPCHHGIYLDVFPFDAVAPDRWWGRFHIGVAGLAKKAHLLLNHPRQGRLSPHRPRWQRMLGRLAYLLSIPLGTLLPFGWHARLYERWVSLLEQPSPTHVVCLVTMPRNRQSGTRGLIRPASEFFQTTMLPFEGHLFPVPMAYDATLSRLYGDYMQLLPPELRRPPHPIVAFALPPEISDSNPTSHPLHPREVQAKKQNMQPMP